MSGAERKSRMEIAAMLKIPMPSPIGAFFDRILTLGWYDGITDGLVCSPSELIAFRFDILAWGPCQDQRVFAFSPISISMFDDVVRLLGKLGPPEWPCWHTKWPSDSIEADLLSQELNKIPAGAEKPSLVIETESMFKTIYSVRQLSGESVDLIPDHFSGIPRSDNYDYWHQYLGLSN